MFFLGDPRNLMMTLHTKKEGKYLIFHLEQAEDHHSTNQSDHSSSKEKGKSDCKWRLKYFSKLVIR
jgi:hypothetical protein